jgi:hypothetical protein
MTTMHITMPSEDTLTRVQMRWGAVLGILLASVAILLFLLPHGRHLDASIKAPEVRVPAAPRVRSKTRIVQHIEPPVQLIDANSLSLHPNVKEYTYTFEGIVACGDSPCRSGHVNIFFNFQHSNPVAKAVPIAPDGTYVASMTIKEVPHEQVGWQIDAHGADGATGELDGTQILDDDNSPVTVEKSIQL